jgi:hypothetical protein
MSKKLSILCVALALALPLAASADNTASNNKAVPVAKKPPQTTPAHHKVKCCSGREAAQPKPPEPTK